MANAETSQSQRRTGFSIHVLTASGALAGLFALQSVIDGHIRAALLWLIICQILDGIDGPIARKFDDRSISNCARRSSGKKLMIRSSAWLALLACSVAMHRCPVSANATACSMV